MKFIKYNSKNISSKSDSFDFIPVSDLKDFNILTSYIKGKSPEFKTDNNKLFMIIEGNVQFNINNKSTEMEMGDIILIAKGETFQFNATTGARILQFTQSRPRNSNEKLNELTSQRHSTREFLNKPVSKKDIYYVLKVGMKAPSGANRQPWKYIVVGDPEVKRKIRQSAEKVEKKYYNNLPDGNLLTDLKKMGLSWKKPFLETAPFLICILGDSSQPYYKESLWLSTGWILLAAMEIGLGTLTYKPDDMSFLNKILGISKNYKPELIIPIGYTSKTEPSLPRKDLSDVVSWI